MKLLLIRKTFKRLYCGISETEFKPRFLNHEESFSHKKTQKWYYQVNLENQLSNELWKIKASKEEPVGVWKILGQC